MCSAVEENGENEKYKRRSSIYRFTRRSMTYNVNPQIAEDDISEYGCGVTDNAIYRFC